MDAQQHQSDPGGNSTRRFWISCSSLHFWTFSLYRRRPLLLVLLCLLAAILIVSVLAQSVGIGGLTIQANTGLFDCQVQGGCSRRVGHERLDFQQPPFDSRSDLQDDFDKEQESIHSLDLTKYIGDLPQYLPSYTNPCWYARKRDDKVPRSGIDHQQQRQEEGRENGAGTYLSYIHARTKEDATIKCLPYVYLIGVSKCGTTDLFAKLVKHPDLVHPYVKEPHWWDRTMLKPDTKKTFSDYIKRFKFAARNIEAGITNLNNSTEEQALHRKVTIDGTPATIWDNQFWRNLKENRELDEPRFLNQHFIRKVTPNIRIIVILRNPTDRYFSDYLFFPIFRKEVKSAKLFHAKVVDNIAAFNECLFNRSHKYCTYSAPSRLKVGLYAQLIKDWLRVFPREQFHFLTLDDVIEDQARELNKIYRFIGLEELSDLSKHKKHVVNNQHAKSEKVGPMWNETRTLLDQFYRQSNIEVAKLLGDSKYLWGQH